MNKPTRCELCGFKFNCLGGITTTEGYFCYDCVKRIHKIADQTAALRSRGKADILADIDSTT
jgi:DNA-directed RNA polymerase subunit RPC12/RpoP